MNKIFEKNINARAKFLIPEYVCEMKIVDGLIINLIYMPNWWNRFWMRKLLGFKFVKK